MTRDLVPFAALVREYQVSGLTLAAFARRAGVKYPTFAGWVYARGGSANRPSAVRFAQLRLPVGGAAPAELSVALPDGVVVRGGDVRWRNWCGRNRRFSRSGTSGANESENVEKPSSS